MLHNVPTKTFTPKAWTYLVCIVSYKLYHDTYCISKSHIIKPLVNLNITDHLSVGMGGGWGGGGVRRSTVPSVFLAGIVTNVVYRSKIPKSMYCTSSLRMIHSYTHAVMRNSDCLRWQMVQLQNSNSHDLKRYM